MAKFVITRRFNNGTVNLHYGPIKTGYNIRLIKPYKSDTKLEDINPENMYDEVKI